MIPSNVLEDIRRIVESAGVDIVEENVSFLNGVLNLKLLVDFPSGGIDIGTCSRINAQIVDYLEGLQDLIPDYSVEVSSPGLDRKLKTFEDFRRVKNYTVEVLLSNKVAGKGQWKGILEEVNEDHISLRVPKGKGFMWMEIPYKDIQQGRVVL